MAAPTIDELGAGLERMSGEMRKAREDSETFVDQFTNLLKVLIPIEAGYKVINSLSGQIGSRFSFALKTLTSTTQEIYAQRRMGQDRLHHLFQEYLAGRATFQQYRDAKMVHTQTRDVFAAQLRLSHAIEAVGRRYLLLAAGIAAQAAAALMNAKKYNVALQDANSSFMARVRLMQDMAKIQIATGTSAANVASAAKALVRYNLDNKATFEANLKTTVMLSESLGMSVDEAAQLASVAENYARVSFQRVADAVATVVDQTALAASEVKTLGMELMKAMAVISPRPAAGLPQVIQALSGYEGALKEVTGQIGGFQKLVNSMATPEGLMAAGVLGVTPEMIRTKEGIELIMSRFEGLVRQQVGNSEGMERVWRLENVARMLNISLSREEIAGMSRALELRRTQSMQEISLQERFQREVVNLDQGFQRLFTSLNTFLQMGIYPFIKILSYGITQLSLLIQKLLDFRYVGVAAFTVVGIGAVVVFTKLRGVARAFLEVAVAVQIATSRLRQYALTQIAQGAVGSGVGTAGRTASYSLSQLLRMALGGAAPAAAGTAVTTYGFRTGLMALLRSLWGGIAGLGRTIWAGFSLIGLPLTLILAAAGGVLAMVAAIKKYNQMEHESNVEAKRNLAQRTIDNERVLRARGMMALRRGESDYALTQFNKILDFTALNARNQGATATQQMAILDAKKKEISELADRIIYTKTAFSPEFVEGTIDMDKADKDVRGVMERIAVASEKMKETSLKTYMKELEGEKDRQEQEDALTLWRILGRWLTPPPPPPGYTGSWYPTTMH